MDEGLMEQHKLMSPIVSVPAPSGGLDKLNRNNLLVLTRVHGIVISDLE